MARNKTHWSADGSYLPEIQPHTKAKHKIYEDYIQRYIVTLCGNNRGKRKTVTFIDGFCGGGMYLDPDNNNALWSGSPIRMIEIVANALDIVKRDKSKPDYELDVKFIFIDSEPDHLDCLKVQMKESGLDRYLSNPEKCEFIIGEFENCIDKCLIEVNRRRGSSLFLLDPFGWSHVSMESIRRIISLGKSEILYTYMIDDIIRFLSEKDRQAENAYHKVLEANGYYEFIKCLPDDRRIKQKYIRDETLRLFRERGSVPCVYSFALLPNKTHPKYYLIHLATKPPAQREIKNTLWDHNTIDLVYQFEYGIYGLGFRTPDYYEQNQSVINLLEENSNKCIENLDTDLMPIIYSNPDGITFAELHNRTMQTNPATVEHYAKYIDEQRSQKELVVMRNGKITTAKRIEPGDLIIKDKRPKQISLFDINKLK
ncbi:three-Cys-motif partner protein TcmP [Calothrix sp. NIES-2098]|uniref:three-Cys-motif partner protein TcmP n=1 Tax=Calothrix sp. NIES-2098 TaxID=1954171 RepID=UPI000B619875|nr:hypothetical protein NIES2098_66790 [Calothrix sp. NIES-2098]